MKKRSEEEKRFIASPEGQKSLWAQAQGLPSDTYAPSRYVPTHTDGKDYGSDPLGDQGNGFRWKMVPSGDIVDAEERKRRLGR